MLLWMALLNVKTYLLRKVENIFFLGYPPNKKDIDFMTTTHIQFFLVGIIFFMNLFSLSNNLLSYHPENHSFLSHLLDNAIISSEDSYSLPADPSTKYIPFPFTCSASFSFLKGSSRPTHKSSSLNDFFVSNLFQSSNSDVKFLPTFPLFMNIL